MAWALSSHQLASLGSFSNSCAIADMITSMHSAVVTEEMVALFAGESTAGQILSAKEKQELRALLFVFTTASCYNALTGRLQR